MDLRYEVVIVGAGPAGCLAALNAPAGMRVLLIDRRSLPRNVICGGVLKPEVVAQLEPYGMPPSVFREPREIRWRLYDWRSGRVGWFRDDWYHNVDRAGFDAWLLDLARSRKGLDVWPEVCFAGVMAGGTAAVPLNVTVRKDGERVALGAAYLIGADGADSAVRRHLGMPLPCRWIALQQTLRFRGEAVDRFLAFLDDSIDFYGWVIPKGDNLLVGAGFDSSSRNIRRRFDDFLGKLEQRHGITGTLVEKTRGRPALRLRSPGDVFAGRGHVLLAGEAAGLICPWSGEGISFAVRSGAMAGAALAAPNPQRAYRKSIRSFMPGLLADLAGRRIMKHPASCRVAATIAPWANYRRVP